MKKWCFAIGIVWGCLSVAAGQDMDKKFQRQFQVIKELVRQRNYDAAIQVLDKMGNDAGRYAEFSFLRADIYDRLGDTDREIEAIHQGLLLDSVHYTNYYYFLGECYFGRGDYVNARQNYKLYLERDTKLSRKEAANHRVINCDFAQKALMTQEKRPVELYIGSDKDVYWPSLDVTGRTVLYTCLDKGNEDIWSYRDGAGIPLNFNTTEGNEGTQSLTADGQMMYFTGCERPDSRGSCDIYVAYRISDTLWSEPINLGYPVNTDAWEAQPAVSADGTKLFFASTRQGGKGGSDIWFSTLLQRNPDGRQLWSQPKPLYFNTSGNEMAPFLYYDGRVLFFASDGYPGMGGMDIYRVDLDSLNEPENIGITVNSYKNEMGFVVDATGRWGYFSSDLDGTKNIYRYELEDFLRCQEMAYLHLITENEEGEKVVPDRLLVIHPEKGDTLAYYDGVYAPAEMLSCVPAQSLLLLSVQKGGYLYYSDTIHVGRADYAHPQTRVIVLKKIRKEASQVLNGIFFDVDDYSLRSESRFELEQLVEFLKNNPSVKIEIAGFTDNSGSAEYNEHLSDARAFEVYKYLFVNHIKKERMSYKGYGMAHPVASNETETGRARNRRTEIKIMN